MSKVLRTSAVVVAAALAVPLWGVPSASAAESSENASNGAYFYSAGVAKPDESPANVPNITADSGADGVSAGNLAVASQGGGQEDKVSFLGFDLAAVPLDATIDKALLAVPLVPNSPPKDVTFAAAPELVRVCKAGDSGFFGEDGTSLALAPERLCDEFSSEPGKLSADGKAYVFDITGLASTWLTMNDGLALTVAEGAAPFQVVFAPSSEATLALSYTALETLPELPVDTSTGSGEVPLAGGFGTESGGSLPTFETGGFGSVEAPSVDTALPEPAPQAQAAPEPAVATTPLRNVNAMTEAPLTPSTSFWVGLLALVGLAALLSLIMGDTRVAPPASVASQSRLTKALQGRQSASAARGPRLARPVTL